MTQEKHGDGFNYTFGDSKAAVNLMGSILQQPEFEKIRPKVLRILTKQICTLKALMVIKDGHVRMGSLKMWHDGFPELVVDLPEVVKTHVRCVETGTYRQLLKDNKAKGVEIKRDSLADWE